MAYLLNFIYALILVIAAPWLVFQAMFRGKYRSGFVAKFLGAVPRAQAVDSRAFGFMPSASAK